MSKTVKNEQAKLESRIKNWEIEEHDHWKSYDTNFVPAEIKADTNDLVDKEDKDELLKLELENERIRNEVLLNKLENQRIKDGLKNEREGGGYSAHSREALREYSDSDVEEVETDIEVSRSCYSETENYQQRDNERWGARSRSPEGYYEKQKGRGKNHRSRSREREYVESHKFRQRELEGRYYSGEEKLYREDGDERNYYNRSRYSPGYEGASYERKNREGHHEYRSRSR